MSYCTFKKVKFFSLLQFIWYLLLISCASDGPQGPEPEPEPPEVVSVDLTSSLRTAHNGEEITFEAKVSSPVSEISFFFDGKSIGTTIGAKHLVKFTLQDLDPKEYIVTAIAKTIKGNSFKAELPVNVLLRLGDKYKGGYIFYLDETGKSGLIAAGEDLKKTVASMDRVEFLWGENALIGTTLDNGVENTKLIAKTEINSAFGYFFKNNLTHNGFSDWYVPSYRELEKLKDAISHVPNLIKTTTSDSYYWSSSERDAVSAYCINMRALSANYNFKDRSLKIRPIRKF